MKIIMTNLKDKIQNFFKSSAYAVVGASDINYKFGYKCYKCYLDHGYKAYPVNPNCKSILDNPTYNNLQSLPEKCDSISVITPPAVTEEIIKEAIAYGVKNIWLQPGAESKLAVEMATAKGINIIWGGPCLLVELGC
jgi:predicted CoA-binding protein